MNINSNNYEAFLLDYFENNLSTGQVAELMIFLQSHPELNVDLESFDLFAVQADNTIVFEDKASLKHSDIKSFSFLTHDNYEEYFVASIDGELSFEEEKDLEIFIGLNPQLKSEYDLFALTVLTPDTTIVFSGKSSLKKGSFGIAHISTRQWLYSSVAVAASIALLIGIFFNFSTPLPKDQLAQFSTEKEHSIINIPHSSITIPQYSPAKNQLNPEPIPVVDGGIASAVIVNQVNTVKQGNPVLIKSDVQDLELIASATVSSLPISNTGQIQINDIPRSYYTELYSYIQLREQREYQEYLDKRDSRSWYAKAFTEVKTLIAGRPDVYDPKGVRRDGEIWMLAEAGLKGINYLTKSDLHLKRQLDEDGLTSAYAVASDRFEYSGKVGK